MNDSQPESGLPSAAYRLFNRPAPSPSWREKNHSSYLEICRCRDNPSAESAATLIAYLADPVRDLRRNALFALLGVIDKVDNPNPIVIALADAASGSDKFEPQSNYYLQDHSRNNPTIVRLIDSAIDSVGVKALLPLRQMAGFSAYAEEKYNQLSAKYFPEPEAAPMPPASGLAYVIDRPASVYPIFDAAI